MSKKPKRSKSGRPAGTTFAELMRFAWQTIKDNIWLVLIVWGAACLVNYGMGRLSELVFPNSLASHTQNAKQVHGPYAAAWTLVEWWLFQPVSTAVAGIAVVKVALLLSAGEKVTWASVKGAYRCFLSFVATSILLFLVIMAGANLLIIPGIIWGVRYSLSGLAVVDRGLSPVQAFRASARVTKQVWWTVFSIWFVFLLAVVASVLISRFIPWHSLKTFIAWVTIGLVVWPFISIVPARLYTLLADKAEA